MNDIREKLKAYLDGELSAEEQALVEQAIQSDPALQEEVNELKQISSLIRQIGESKAYAPSGAEATMSAVRRPRFSWSPRLFALAGAMVLVAVFLFPAMRSGMRGVGSVETMAVGGEMAPAATPMPSEADADSGVMAGSTGTTGTTGTTGSTGRYGTGANSSSQWQTYRDDFAADATRSRISGKLPRIESQATVSTNDVVNGSPADSLIHQQLIRTASLTVKVPKVTDATQTATQIVKGLGGYVETSNSSSTDKTRPTATITLRVPVKNFDTLLNKVRALGEVLEDNSSSEDVTATVADVNARLKVMKAEEDSYITMLRAARKVGEMLEIKERLSSVRQEIESLEAQQRALGSQTSYSTVTCVFTQAPAVGDPKPSESWSDDAWSNAVNGLQSALRFLGQGLINVFVYSPLWLPPVLLIWWLGRKARK